MLSERECLSRFGNHQMEDVRRFPICSPVRLSPDEPIRYQPPHYWQLARCVRCGYQHQTEIGGSAVNGDG